MTKTVNISNKTPAELAATPKKIYRDGLGKEIRPPLTLSCDWRAFKRKM